MHFRTRQKVVQLIRTTYDAAEKKPKAAVIASISLDHPEITPEMRRALTDKELKETEAWIENHGRLWALKEELAALGLVENLRLAGNWFAKNAGSRSAFAAVANVLPALHAFRKTLRDKGFV